MLLVTGSSIGCGGRLSSRPREDHQAVEEMAMTLSGQRTKPGSSSFFR
jgi:hypothetical protein